jgi:uncharacterized protein YlxP (DUF503 family)
MIGLLTVHLHLPGCGSLKEKRGRLKPLLARLHRQFNISVESVICCGMVGNNSAFLQSALEMVRKWAEANWPDGDLLDTKIEIW